MSAIGPDPLRMDDQAWEFVSAIRQGRACVPSFREGVRAQQVADAVLQAASERRWVDVPPETPEEA
ncbi:MAG: Gfo/Idh/MocA family oxidoreductase [Candidatus Latescibacterota bacterium]